MRRLGGTHTAVWYEAVESTPSPQLCCVCLGLAPFLLCFCLVSFCSFFTVLFSTLVERNVGERVCPFVLLDVYIHVGWLPHGTKQQCSVIFRSALLLNEGIYENDVAFIQSHEVRADSHSNVHTTYRKRSV